MAEVWVTINGSKVLIKDGFAQGEVAEKIADENRQKAVEYFGTTKDIREAGYILSDGEMLDFSGRHEGNPESGTRTVDHRDIWDATESGADGTEAMVSFINEGNIRLSPESGGLEMSRMPNEKQLMAIREYVYYFDGEVFLDISDAAGKVVIGKEYSPKTSPTKVINDIKAHFK